MKKDTKKNHNSSSRRTSNTVFKGFPCESEEQCRKCVSFYDDRKIIVCQEHKSKYTLKKEERFDTICYHVDGGIIEKDEAVLKCDYAFYLKDKETKLILVELKGTNTEHALEQLSSMLDMKLVKDVISERSASRLYGRVVSLSGVPKIYTIEQLKLNKRFKLLGGNLKILRTNETEEYQKLSE